MARLVFRDNQANCLIEQVPHRRDSVPELSTAGLRADTLDHRGGSYRDRNPACHDRCVNADYQSTFWLVSSNHAQTGWRGLRVMHQPQRNRSKAAFGESAANSHFVRRAAVRCALYQCLLCGLVCRSVGATQCLLKAVRRKGKGALLHNNDPERGKSIQ